MFLPQGGSVSAALPVSSQVGADSLVRNHPQKYFPGRRRRVQRRTVGCPTVCREVGRLPLVRGLPLGTLVYLDYDVSGRRGPQHM